MARRIARPGVVHGKQGWGCKPGSLRALHLLTRFSRLSGFYHHMRVVMYRPSPQVPQPSAAAAELCYDSSAFVLNMTRKQMDSGLFNVTWVFLIMLNSCLNTLLWSTSYQEVRQAHMRSEVEELVEMALTCLDRCAERWPGTAYQAQLYSIISKACLQSYERTPDSQRPMFSFASPSSGTEAQPSPEGYLQSGVGPQQLPYLNPPQFGFVFDSPPESMNAYTFDPNYPPPQPAFRSNSIFCNPATDSNGRRFSYFPPELQTGFGETGPNDSMGAAPTQAQDQAQGQGQGQGQQGYAGNAGAKGLPTPPDSLAAGALSTTTPNSTVSPPNMPTQPSNLSDPSAAPRVVPMHENLSPPQKYTGTQPFQPQQQTPNFTTARPSVPQRPLPTATSNADWFSPPAPFISPYNFGPMSSNFFNDPMPGGFGDAAGGASMGMHGNNMATGMDPSGQQFSFLPGRQGSLTQSQQVELMNTLETDGMGDIDAFLNANSNMADVQWY